MVEIAILNRRAELDRVHRSFADYAVRHGLSSDLVSAADLALEELLTNIISYAFEPGVEHTVLVRFSIRDGFLEVEVEDDGNAFNPLEHPEADISVPIQRKPVGGLGIHLIRRLMDDVLYRRCGDRNILTLRKRI